MIFNLMGGTVGAVRTIHANSAETLPTSVAEGTLAIISQTRPGKVLVQNTEPTAPASGDVWISTDVSSSAPIQTGNITIYPSSAKQYVAVAWVTVTAYVFSGGAWIPLETYLFKNGDLYESITGGWVRMWRDRECAEITDTALVADASYQYRRAAFRTKNAVDLTSYKTLRAVFTPITKTYGGEYCVALGVNNTALAEGEQTNSNAPGLTNPNHCMTGYTQTTINHTDQFTLDYDISDVIGEQYVTIYFHTLDSSCIEVQLLS